MTVIKRIFLSHVMKYELISYKRYSFKKVILLYLPNRPLMCSLFVFFSSHSLIKGSAHFHFKASFAVKQFSQLSIAQYDTQSCSVSPSSCPALVDRELLYSICMRLYLLYLHFSSFTYHNPSLIFTFISYCACFFNACMFLKIHSVVFPCTDIISHHTHIRVDPLDVSLYRVNNYFSHWKYVMLSL
jgi:hypothetical protein